MTLIEVMFKYRELVSLKGREKANAWLKLYTLEKFWAPIINSVSDEGSFINSEGKTLAP